MRHKLEALCGRLWPQTGLPVVFLRPASVRAAGWSELVAFTRWGPRGQMLFGGPITAARDLRDLLHRSDIDITTETAWHLLAAVRRDEVAGLLPTLREVVHDPAAQALRYDAEKQILISPFPCNRGWR